MPSRHGRKSRGAVVERPRVRQSRDLLALRLSIRYVYPRHSLGSCPQSCGPNRSGEAEITSAHPRRDEQAL